MEYLVERNWRNFREILEIFGGSRVPGVVCSMVCLKTIKLCDELLFLNECLVFH